MLGILARRVPAPLVRAGATHAGSAAGSDGVVCAGFYGSEGVPSELSGG